MLAMKTDNVGDFLGFHILPRRSTIDAMSASKVKHTQS